MRIILMFDLPTESSEDKKNYRHFVKYLTNDGYIRIQFSVYSKLCINSNSAMTYAKRLKLNSPTEGNIRYLIITEKQYQSIENINSTYSFQENVTTEDRTLMIGGMNDEDSN